MSRPKTQHVCHACGDAQPRWLGKCPACGAWDSYREEAEVAPAPRRLLAPGPSRPVLLHEAASDERPRRPTGIRELDRVLGGGVVAGSVILLGGDPGIGKSTLILEACDGIARAGGRALYVTGEESVAQTRLRAERLGIAAGAIYVVTENALPAILQHVEETRPDLVVVDSIQMVYRPDLPSAPGSVAQVRECAAEFVTMAKSSGVPFVLVGHVTKEGAIAGPRVLEHLVDTVLYFEGQRFQTHRLLRAIKNRFGPTSELALFEMTDGGLREVENPSAFFMSQYKEGVPGSVIVPLIEGTRPLLVEIQALVAGAGYGVPQRRVTGPDPHRAAMIIAVLERRGGLALGTHDVFVNAAGGAVAEEPAADLAIALAIAGSLLDRRVPARSLAVGELGLGGEVRPVHQIGARLKEAERMGFTAAFVPPGTRRALPPDLSGMEVQEAGHISEALRWCGKM